MKQLKYNKNFSILKSNFIVLYAIYIYYRINFFMDRGQLRLNYIGD